MVISLEITSRKNPEYTKLKEKITKSEQDLRIEGKKLFTEAVKSSLKISSIYINKKNLPQLKKICPNYKSSELFFLSDELLADLYSTTSKPENENLIFALAKKPIWQLEHILSLDKNLIFLENIQDPGNLGTIIRSSLAFNIGCVFLSANSVNPYSTKVIRASAGAVFKMPVLLVSNINGLLTLAKKNQFEVIATLPTAKKLLTEPDDANRYNKNLYLFGNEGSGLSKELIKFSDKQIRIPHSRNIESLNLAVAVSILLWEIYG